MQQDNRYIRQTILPGFGHAAQEKLLHAKVLIVGAGGLGCPALQYLVAAGVGTIGIMDPDKVSLSNLHRQPLFSEKNIGTEKVMAAKEKLQSLNSNTTIVTYAVALSRQNALELISQYDMVIDGTDNFSAKYLINDACVILGKPFVYGAVSRFDGQLSVFNISSESRETITYRDLFPVPPVPGEIKTCEETGVIGMLPGMIGTMQAAEAVKLITGLGEPLYGRLFTYDLLQARTYEIILSYHKNKPILSRELFEETDDSLFNPEEIEVPEISIQRFSELVKAAKAYVLDVRERHEYPSINFADAQIPMSELREAIDDLPEKDIYVICHQGIRSVYAAQLIKARRSLNVYSVKGGLTAYFKQLES